MLKLLEAVAARSCSWPGWAADTPARAETMPKSAEKGVRNMMKKKKKD